MPASSRLSELRVLAARHIAAAYLPTVGTAEETSVPKSINASSVRS